MRKTGIKLLMKNFSKGVYMLYLPTILAW